MSLSLRIVGQLWETPLYTSARETATVMQTRKCIRNVIVHRLYILLINHQLHASASSPSRKDHRTHTLSFPLREQQEGLLAASSSSSRAQWGHWGVCVCVKIFGECANWPIEIQTYKIPVIPKTAQGEQRVCPLVLLLFPAYKLPNSFGTHHQHLECSVRFIHQSI